MITELLPLLDGWAYVGQDVDIRLREKGWQYVPAYQERVLFEADKPGWVFGVAIDFKGSKYATVYIEYYDAYRGWASVTLSPYGMHSGGLGYVRTSGLALAMYDEDNDHYCVAFMPPIPFPVKASPERKARVRFQAAEKDATIYGVEVAMVVITDEEAFLRSLRRVYGLDEIKRDLDIISMR